MLQSQQSRPTLLSLRGQRAIRPPISNLMAIALQRPEVVSLAAGFVDQSSLPSEEIENICSRILAGDAGKKILQYGSTEGNTQLRKKLVERLQSADAAAMSQCGMSDNVHENLTDANILLTSGSNQLLYSALDVLANPQDIILCAAPTYFVFTGVLQNMNVQSFGYEVDEFGPIPDSVNDAFAFFDRKGELERIKAIYAVSYFDNPRGITFSLDRRLALLDLASKWSRKHKIYVLEDAAYRQLRFRGDDLPSMKALDQDDRVLMAETFSKTFAPGVRVGWGVIPKELMAPMAALKGNFDFGSPAFNQAIVLEALQGDTFDNHVQKLIALYDSKRAVMIDQLNKSLGNRSNCRWIDPAGGLYVWLSLPDSIDTGPTGSLFQEALDQGVLYVPGQYCYPGEGVEVGSSTIRLSYGVQQEAGIRKGIDLLANAISAVS
jgi:2-aminoadipate transaminase